jgi:hypothetical protein
MAGLLFSFVCVWGTGHDDSSGCGAFVDFYKTLFSDAEPKTEVIAEVPTRHLTVNMLVAPKDYVPTYPGPFEQGPHLAMSLSDIKAATLDVWVSTDATPRILRTRYEIAVLPAESNDQAEPTPGITVSYSLTWTWSRFNEQFPTIVAPTGGPAQAPIPPEPTATLVPRSEPTPAGMPRTGLSATGWEDMVATSLIGGLLLAGLLLRKVRG